jgi:hypothetical protein
MSSYGGCNAAVAALTVSLEDAPIGHHAAGRAAEVLIQLRRGLLADGANLGEKDDAVFDDHCRRLVRDNDRPFGFEVPFRERDERVDMVSDRVAARGRSDLPYWRLFVKAADAFWRMKRLRPNIPVAMGAICLDMGFTSAQIGPLMTVMCASPFWANAVEGAEQAPACLQTLPADCVRYVGPGTRLSPRGRRA